jgi:hypothetical protein
LVDAAEQLSDFFLAQTGLPGFCNGRAEQFPGALRFQLAAAIIAVAGNESAQALPTQDDALPLQFLVSMFDSNDADHQFASQLPERGKGSTFRQTAFADLALKTVHDLLVERASRRGDGRQQTSWSFLVHCIYCICYLYTVNWKSKK